MIPPNMKINRVETLRYMRMGTVEPDAILNERLNRVEGEVLAACRPVS